MFGVEKFKILELEEKIEEYIMLTKKKHRVISLFSCWKGFIGPVYGVLHRSPYKGTYFSITAGGGPVYGGGPIQGPVEWISCQCPTGGKGGGKSGGKGDPGQSACNCQFIVRPPWDGSPHARWVRVLVRVLIAGLMGCSVKGPCVRDRG